LGVQSHIWLRRRKQTAGTTTQNKLGI
jgi:hypothetical protein